MISVKRWLKKNSKVLIVLYLFKALVDNYKVCINPDCKNINFCKNVTFCKHFLPILTETLYIPSTYNINCCREISDTNGTEDTIIRNRNNRKILQDGYTIQ